MRSIRPVRRLTAASVGSLLLIACSVAASPTPSPTAPPVLGVNWARIHDVEQPAQDDVAVE